MAKKNGTKVAAEFTTVKLTKKAYERAKIMAAELSGKLSKEHGIPVRVTAGAAIEKLLMGG